MNTLGLGCTVELQIGFLYRISSLHSERSASWPSPLGELVVWFLCARFCALYIRFLASPSCLIGFYFFIVCTREIFKPTAPVLHPWHSTIFVLYKILCFAAVADGHNTLTVYWMSYMNSSDSLAWNELRGYWVEKEKYMKGLKWYIRISFFSSGRLS